jgi:hypothetical protein
MNVERASRYWSGINFLLYHFCWWIPLLSWAIQACVTVLATACGGKVTFARYDLTWWDDIFHCTEMLWSWLKTAMQQSLYFQMDADGYLCNFYHCMACYFSVKDGLYWHESVNPRISHAVFPDLKNVSSKSVANQMTNSYVNILIQR